MGNAAQHSCHGYVCPVRGCDKRKNRRFTLLGLAQHIIKNHPGELEKRLRAKETWRSRVPG